MSPRPPHFPSLAFLSSMDNTNLVLCDVDTDKVQLLMKVAENTMEHNAECSSWGTPVPRYPMNCTKVKSLLNEHLFFGFKAVNPHCQLVMFNISLYFASRVDGACYKVLIFARSSMPFCWLTASSEPLPMTTAGKEEALLLNDSQGNKKKKKRRENNLECLADL